MIANNNFTKLLRVERLFLTRFFAVLFLLFAGISVYAHDGHPVKIVVISRSADVMLDAKKAFDKKYGKGLIELSVSDGKLQIAADKVAKADIILGDHVTMEIAEQITNRCEPQLSEQPKLFCCHRKV